MPEPRTRAFLRVLAVIEPPRYGARWLRICQGIMGEQWFEEQQEGGAWQITDPPEEPDEELDEWLM